MKRCDLRSMAPSSKKQTAREPEHKPLLEAETREGRLYLCGTLVAYP